MEQVKKEERSELVSIWVTPPLKKEFELAKDNQSIKEHIIKRYLHGEVEWLESELKEIDEATIKYSAKLIGIKEAFGKCQDAYVQEIEQMHEKAYATFRKLDTIATQTQKNIDQSRVTLSEVINKVNNIDFHKIEKMLSLIEKINSMSSTELDLLKKIISA